MLRQVRTVLIVIGMFSSIDELMAFVEKMLLKKPKRLPWNLTGTQSKYQAIFNDPTHTHRNGIGSLAFGIYAVYQTILKIPEINALFQSQKHHAFLLDQIPKLTNLPKTMVKIHWLLPANIM